MYCKHTQTLATILCIVLYCIHAVKSGILQGRILEWVVIPFSRGLPSPGVEPRSPALQADSLPSKPPGKTQGHTR